MKIQNTVNPVETVTKLALWQMFSKNTPSMLMQDKDTNMMQVIVWRDVHYRTAKTTNDTRTSSKHGWKLNVSKCDWLKGRLSER